MSPSRLESERAGQPVRRQESHRFPSPARAYASPAPAREPGPRQALLGDSSPILAMLAARGIPPRQIAAAAAGARQQGVSVGDFLIGNGYVSPETLYRFVAQYLGVPFMRDRLPLRDDVDPHIAAKRGMAPIVPGRARGARLVLAPRGAGLERLLAGAHTAKNLRPHFAVTTPAHLEDALRTHAGQSIARAASHGLSEIDPVLSARSGPTKKEAAIALLSFAAVIPLGLSLPHAAEVCLAFVFFSAVVLRLFAIAMSSGTLSANATLRDAELPIYTIIIALYREDKVISHLIAALERLDYARAKLDAKIVVEADDLETIAALRAVRSRFPFDVVVAPPGLPRTKPRALNVALPFARGALTCVFDAEDEPANSQLRRAAEIFALLPRDVACLQARLIVDNYADNWLTRGIMAQTPPRA